MTGCLIKNFTMLTGFVILYAACSSVPNFVVSWFRRDHRTAKRITLFVHVTSASVSWPLDAAAEEKLAEPAFQESLEAARHVHKLPPSETEVQTRRASH